MAGEVTMIERIPVELNLDGDKIVGLAAVSKELESGEITIVIVLDPSSKLELGMLVDIFKIKAIGFAAVKKKEDEDGG